MKIVKLNRRFKQYRENRHTVALRFDHHSTETIAIERVCRERLPGFGVGWLPHADWFGYYGSRPKNNSPRPYWITFRNEMDLTLVLLSIKKDVA